jgi:uncharacterized protein YerC
MPLIDKFKSRKELDGYVWNQLVENLAKTLSPRGTESSLTMLTTASERKQITTRAAALELLKQGKSYSEISKVLWLSPTTISAIRKSLRGGKGYVSGYGWGNTKRKGGWSVYPQPVSKRLILPHGKLVYPQKRNR